MKLHNLIICVLLLPILLPIVILLKLTSEGEILYFQERIGLKNKPFMIYKFATMVKDSHKMKGGHITVKNDPRLTFMGGFLRKTKINELPQLFNILTGSMTLIGPRPPVPSEVENYKDSHMRRLSMKPGITGLWQVSGRNSVKDFDEWVKLDLEYIDNWSFMLDFKIAVKTVGTVLLPVY